MGLFSQIQVVGGSQMILLLDEVFFRASGIFRLRVGSSSSCRSNPTTHIYIYIYGTPPPPSDLPFFALSQVTQLHCKQTGCAI